jgi:hypothetical protein
MEPRPLRIAYAIEFLLALIACFECWSQIGGQAPLDLMPWWLKFLLATGFATAVVRLTAIAVHNEKFPSVPLIRWAIALVLVLAVIAVTTYYFYLRVPPDEENSDEPIPTSYSAPLV